jgi:hypothetical protein
MALDPTLRASLQRQLAARAIERWGLARANELGEAIDALAASLALVAAAPVGDEIEPDPGVPSSREGRQP